MSFYKIVILDSYNTVCAMQNTLVSYKWYIIARQCSPFLAFGSDFERLLLSLVVPHFRFLRFMRHLVQCFHPVASIPLRTRSKIPPVAGPPLPFLSSPTPLTIPSLPFPATLSKGLGVSPSENFWKLDGCGWNLMHFWIIWPLNRLEQRHCFGCRLFENRHRPILKR